MIEEIKELIMEAVEEMKLGYSEKFYMSKFFDEKMERDWQIGFKEAAINLGYPANREVAYARLGSSKGKDGTTADLTVGDVIFEMKWHHTDGGAATSIIKDIHDDYSKIFDRGLEGYLINIVASTHIDREHRCYGKLYSMQENLDRIASKTKKYPVEVSASIEVELYDTTVRFEILEVKQNRRSLNNKINCK